MAKKTHINRATGTGTRAKSPIDKACDPLTFFKKQPLYEDLCREVEYILRKRLKTERIPVGPITSRAKNYERFTDKVRGHAGLGAFGKILDRAGARVVYLYRSDLPRIEKAIRDEFQVLDKKDASSKQGPGEFGYSDVKFYVKLKKQKGPRYDDLKNLICEIQVRTVMQDAWGLVSRDLLYTKESEIPKESQRRLRRFVGMFEEADERFDEIRAEINRYRKNIEVMTEEEFLKQPINLDTLAALIEKYYMDKPLTQLERSQLPLFADNLRHARYSSLKDVHAKLRQYANAPNMARQYYKGLPMSVIDGLICTLAVLDQQFYRRCSPITRLVADKCRSVFTP